MSATLRAVHRSSTRSGGAKLRVAGGHTTTPTAPHGPGAPFGIPTPHAAYGELLGAARWHSVAVMAIASALADLTCVRGESPGATLGPVRPASHPESGGLLAEGGPVDVFASLTGSLRQIVERAILIEQLQSKQRIAEQLDIPRMRSDQQAPKAPWQGCSEVVSELTRREYEILQLMTTGATNREIATTIFVSVETVKWHVKHILQKFGAANRAQAVATYFESLDRR